MTSTLPFFEMSRSVRLPGAVAIGRRFPDRLTAYRVRPGPVEAVNQISRLSGVHAIPCAEVNGPARVVFLPERSTTAIEPASSIRLG